MHVKRSRGLRRRLDGQDGDEQGDESGSHGEIISPLGQDVVMRSGLRVVSGVVLVGGLGRPRIPRAAGQIRG